MTTYARLDMLTRADVAWNVNRLRNKADKHRKAGRMQRAAACDAHADALTAWDRARSVVPLRSVAGATSPSSAGGS